MPKSLLSTVIFTVAMAIGANAQAEGSSKWLSEFLLSTNYHKKADTAVNSTNRVFEIPTTYSVFEYRPDFSYTTETFKSVVRARVFVGDRYTEYSGPAVQTNSIQGRSDLSDAFVEWTPSDIDTYALGLQNYQWGPAELYSPSNPFFHFNSQQKTFFYKEKGRALVRVNVSLNDQTSLFAMTEPIGNNETNWIAEHDFYPKSLLKIEYQFAERSNYIAFLGGSGEQGHAFFGQYGNFSLTSGFSFYADIKEESGVSQFEPRRTSEGVDDLIYRETNNDWSTIALGGFRYELPSVDMREEFLYSSNSYDSDQWRRVQQLTSTPSLNFARNLSRFARPGLEFLTQWYSYTSLRIPDLGKQKDANIYLRYLDSITDGSGVFQLDFDKAWGTAGTVYFEGLFYQGSRSTEFHFAEDYQLAIGAKVSI